MSVSVFPVPLSGIQETLVNAKGDIIAATAADTLDRLAVGTNGQVLTANSATATGLEFATPAGGGKVLQVIQATTTTDTTVASTTHADTTLTANITPSFATSKILVMVTQAVDCERSTTSQGLGLRLMRGATAIMNNALDYQTYYVSQTSGSNYITGYAAYTYLDSPATTSATTYKTQIRAYSTASAGSAGCQDTGAMSTITLMEIGA